LILTKPLGTGAILAAWMRGECSAADFEAAISQMLIANAAAAEALARCGVRACTDITGFGLAGHLLEMLDASRVSARLSAPSVPVLAGFSAVAARGILSTLHPDNERQACRVQSAGRPPAWLFDPQTSGGLLAAVSPSVADSVLAELHDHGLSHAAVIGSVQNSSASPVIELVEPR
jgi:selenide,water dikinase